MAVQIREIAEQVLFARTLEEKLAFPRGEIVDTRPGEGLPRQVQLGRPAHLVLRSQGVKASPPAMAKWMDDRERGKLLHFFCNHELLATELMALALLRFPDAPASFRKGLVETLKEEQIHTRLYMHRMEQCGVDFGELPLSDYFWKSVSSMEDPLDYVTRLSLTFEQANLDYSRDYANLFVEVGDSATAAILSRIYRDEIGHVGFGLKWFRRWKAEGKTDWEAFRETLHFPLSPARAKGRHFNRQGRSEAGLGDDFIRELEVYEQSRGRTPTVFWFNPDAETFASRNAPGDSQDWISTVQEDLAFLPAYLSRQGDIVIMPKVPSKTFLRKLQNLGIPLPEILTCQAGEKSPDINRKIGAIRPWAWTPDSVAFFEDSFAHVTRQMNPDTLWNSSIRNLFSQAFSAEWGSGFERENFLEDWNASNQIYGRLAENLDDLEACRDWFRAFGFPDVVCKAPFGTAAGGNRCVLEKEGMTRPMKDWLTKIWEEQGAVVVEPWLDRVYDFSVQFEMGESGLKLVAFTRLINNARGQFRGILTNAFCKDAEEEISRFLLQPGQKRPRVYEWYDNVLRPRLEVVLKEVGFRGPLGLDAFVFREPGGALRLKTLVEINPRITMGRVAHELSRHAADGAAGLFQIVSRKQVKKSGFASLSEYAAELEKAHPAQFANKTGSRIQSGSLAVTDPETARNFLAVFHVRRAVGEILPLLF